jgi:hypothetical protein
VPRRDEIVDLPLLRGQIEVAADDHGSVAGFRQLGSDVVAYHAEKSIGEREDRNADDPLAGSARGFWRGGRRRGRCRNAAMLAAESDQTDRNHKQQAAQRNDWHGSHAMARRTNWRR